MTSQPWPAKLPVQNVRIARPTDRLENGAVTVEDPDRWRVVLMPQSLAL